MCRSIICGIGHPARLANASLRWTRQTQQRAHIARGSALSAASSEAAQGEMTGHLEHLIETSRIRAAASVIVADDVPRVIQQASSKAAVAILGFEAPEEGEKKAFFEGMESLAGGLPRVIFVDSAGGVELET